MMQWIWSLSFLLMGCYSFSGTTLPNHLRTIQIEPIINQTLESSLPDKIALGIEEGFRKRSNLRKVNENGDARLIGSLLKYNHSAQNTSGSTVTSYRVDILMKVLFVDKIKGDTLYKEDNLPGYGYYTVTRGETEETGQKLAIEELVKVLLDHTVSGW